MYLPARLISVHWGTTDKCYRFSFDLFTAAVDRVVELARRRLRAVFFQSKRPDLRTSEVKTKRNIKDYTLTNIVFDDDE